jgi:hypothetical protein
MDFGGGRVTSENQASVPENCLLVANNILVHSGAPQPIAGYKLVQTLDLIKVERMYSFERATDKKQFFVATGPNSGGGNSIILATIDGSGAVQVLSTTEAAADYDFLQTVHTLYMANGVAPKKVIDVAGVNTLESWGLQLPPQAPTIETGAGTLNLVFGRRYVYSEVRKWTDAQGVERFHISAPSDFSAHTGPLGARVADAGITSGLKQLVSATAVFVAGDVGVSVIVKGAGVGGGDLITVIDTFTNATTVQLHDAASTTVANATLYYRNKTVTVGGMIKFNPQATHFWIFATTDTIIDGTDSYFFAAEIPSAQTSWADSLYDTDLDTTRSAPWDNYPPPAGALIALEYQGRAALIYDDKLQLSALNEIDLGIAMDAFPKTLLFPIPGGVKNFIGAGVFQNTLLIATEDKWIRITYDASTGTFTKTDNVLFPGAVSRKAIKEIHGRWVWLGRDKKLWAWTGVSGDDPLPANNSILASSADQLSADDVSDALLNDCELQWFSRGTFDFAILLSSSDHNVNGEKDWIQMWDLTPIVGSKTVQGYVQQPSLTDFFPYDQMHSSLVAKSNGSLYTFLGSNVDGKIFRWPDGNTFNGEAIDNAAFGTPWMKIADGKLRLFFTKILSNIAEAYTQLRVRVSAGNGTSRISQSVDAETIALGQDDDNPDTTVAVVNMNQKGLSNGQFVKLFVIFPALDMQMTIDAIQVWYKQLKKV